LSQKIHEELFVLYMNDIMQLFDDVFLQIVCCDDVKSYYVVNKLTTSKDGFDAYTIQTCYVYIRL